MLHLLIATEITITDIFKWLTSGGIIGILVYILVGGSKGWWVFGWQYDDALNRIKQIEKERDDWRDIALQGTQVAEKTVDLFKRSGRD